MLQALESVDRSRSLSRTPGMDRSVDPGTLQRLGARDAVFYEGDPADSFFEVVDGIVKLFKLLPDGRCQITGFVYPGSFLGLSLDGSYIYTAEAVTAVTVRRMRPGRLEQLINQDPDLVRRLLALTHSELIVAQDQMLLLGRKSPLEKIASFLLYLAHRGRNQDKAAAQIDLPISRADIADYLGLTIETVSRSFTKLRKAKLISLLQPHQVVLLDPERLADLACGDEDSLL